MRYIRASAYYYVQSENFIRFNNRRTERNVLLRRGVTFPWKTMLVVLWKYLDILLLVRFHFSRFSGKYFPVRVEIYKVRFANLRTRETSFYGERMKNKKKREGCNSIARGILEISIYLRVKGRYSFF